jgi:hypothetical protein
LFQLSSLPSLAILSSLLAFAQPTKPAVCANCRARRETRRTGRRDYSEALGSTGVGQGVALLALARTTLAAWDPISGRIVRPFDLSWRPADTYWIVCPKATAKVAKIGRSPLAGGQSS